MWVRIPGRLVAALLAVCGWLLPTPGLAQESASAGQASVGGLLATPVAPAQSLDPELDALAAQLGDLAASTAYKDAAVQRAVDLGKRAVLQATRARAAGDAQLVARKKAVAQAALALAERAAERREETRAEAAALHSAAHAEQAKAQAEIVLEQAKQRLAELQTEPR
jgi:hypothetical protein